MKSIEDSIDEIRQQVGVTRKKSYRKAIDYDYVLQKGEVNHSDSLTVPDESYSIRDILEKFTCGIAPPVMRNIEYDEDDYLTNENIDYEQTVEDITDCIQGLDSARANIAREQERQREEQAERERIELEKAEKPVNQPIETDL